MITNKDIRVENGSLILNGDPYPLDGQSPEAIMQIVEDNSDTTPTENSDAPITSGGVYTALGTKQDTLTFDTAPTDESTNPITSGGVYTALSNLVKYKDVTVNTSTNGYEAPSSTAGGVYIESLASYEALGVDREKIIGIIPVDWSSLSQPLSFYLGATALKVMLHGSSSIYSNVSLSYVKLRIVYHS